MLILLLLMLTGCASSGAVIDSGCVVFEPIYISQADELTEGTAQQIWVHNETWKSVCE